MNQSHSLSSFSSTAAACAAAASVDDPMSGFPITSTFPKARMAGTAWTQPPTKRAPYPMPPSQGGGDTGSGGGRQRARVAGMVAVPAVPGNVVGEGRWGIRVAADRGGEWLAEEKAEDAEKPDMVDRRRKRERQAADKRRNSHFFSVAAIGRGGEAAGAGASNYSRVKEQRIDVGGEDFIFRWSLLLLLLCFMGLGFVWRRFGFGVGMEVMQTDR